MVSLVFWLINAVIFVLVFLDQILIFRNVWRNGIQADDVQHKVIVKYGKFLIAGKIGLFLTLFLIGLYLEEKHFNWFMIMESLAVLAWITYDVRKQLIS
jgi:hypothetical protein